ncbi:hypothetical protein BK687P2_00009 [Bacteroides phage BK687P2]|nr:hypothetical protein BK687P2_00009 [Bacteroides phage BK687P2]
MYIILVAILIVIAAYYPIKLIKFYSMESTEQALKAKITQDLREGRVSRNLILLVLGEGGLRLTRNQLDVIFEWMLNHSDAWRVTSDRCFIVVFGESPFRPDCWSSLEDYKHVMRQMFGDHETPDFLDRRCSVMEARIILEELKNPIAVNGYVVFNFEGVETLGMITNRSAYKFEFTVRMLSGVKRGMFYLCDGTELTAISPESAIRELARQKEEWKNKKREEAIAEQRETFREKYGNIVRGSYLKSGISLYMVESVDIEEEKVTAIRLLYSVIKHPAGERCVLPLENGFKLITAEEAAEILLKEYSNE